MSAPKKRVSYSKRSRKNINKKIFSLKKIKICNKCGMATPFEIKCFMCYEYK